MQKINWKLFVERPETASPDVFFKVFNTWIPGSPEVFVDVADYQHAHDGPRTALVGYCSDFWLDDAGSRVGLLYNRRAPMEGTGEEKLKRTLGELFRSCRRLEQDPEFGGRLKFRTDELVFRINDRGLAPNTAETFDRVRAVLAGVLSGVYGGTSFVLDRVTDPRQRFTVNISSLPHHPLDHLIQRLTS